MVWLKRQLLYSDIKFSIKSLDEKTHVSFIPISDGFLRKDFLVFFLPYMKPNEIRSLAISYEWPDFFKTLVSKGVDDIYWDNMGFSRGATTDFKSEFIFARDIGEIEVENIGAVPEGLALDIQTRDSDRVVTLAVPKMPSGQAKYRLRFKKKEGGST